MAKNIEMNVLNSNGQYEIIYPKINTEQITNALLNSNVVLGSGVTTNFIPTSDNQVINKGYVDKLENKRVLVGTLTLSQFNNSTVYLPINKEYISHEYFKNCTGIVIEYKNLKYYSIPSSNSVLGFNISNSSIKMGFLSGSFVESKLPLISGEIYLPRLENDSVICDSLGWSRYTALFEIRNASSFAHMGIVIDRWTQSIQYINITRNGSNYYTDGIFNVYLCYENKYNSFTDYISK